MRAHSPRTLRELAIDLTCYPLRVDVLHGRGACRTFRRNMKSDPERPRLAGDPAQYDVRVRCLTLIDDLHAKLDQAFDDLLSIPQSRGRARVRQSTVVSRTEPPDRIAR